MTNQTNTFLGKGWNFPIAFDVYSKELKLVSDEESIRQSIWMLLSTKQGERVMYPQYGHQLYTIAFEVIDQTLLNRIINHLQDIFMMHEPRITIEDINIEIKDEIEGLLHIDLKYIVRLTNTRTNLVYPYYLLEK